MQQFQDQQAFETQQANMQAAVIVASKLSTESGMPLEKLMRYQDPQTMRLAAEDYADRKADKDRIAALEARIGRTNGTSGPGNEGAKPPGDFDSGAGSGAGADEKTLAAMGATGELAADDPQWLDKMRGWGLAPPDTK